MSATKNSTNTVATEKRKKIWRLKNERLQPRTNNTSSTAINLRNLDAALNPSTRIRHKRNTKNHSRQHGPSKTMKEISEGDFFELTTDKQVSATRKVIKLISEENVRDLGLLVQGLSRSDVGYDRKGDCKSFVKNLCRSCNHAVVNVSGSRTVRLRST